MQNQITQEEAKSLIDQIGPHIDKRYDFTYSPVFPKSRKDICAIKRLAENGTSYGFDTIYLIWKTNNNLQHQEIANSSSTKDYIHINEISEDENSIIVKYSSGGSYSGSPWNKTFTISKKELSLN